MNNKILIGLSVSLMSMYSIQTFSLSQHKVSKKDRVEKSLILPVTFVGEKAKKFSVNERMKHYKVPGFSFALINNGKIEWSQGYGSLSNSGEVDVTKETRFQAASIAKPVTAYAVMRMHDKNHLDLNENIEKYLGTFEWPRGKHTKSNPVTLKKLLAHTAGLTPGGYLGYEKGALLPTDEQVFLGQSPSSSKGAKVESIPGQAVKYSGAGYTLTEIIVQKLLQQPFEQLMSNWVLVGTEMTASTFDQSLTSNEQTHIAKGHHSNGELVTGGWKIHPEQAAAGLWSTPTDLAKFAIEMSDAYLGKSNRLTQESARLLLSPIFEEKDLSDSFGGQPAITFVVNGKDSDFMFSHGGGNVGYRSYMVMYPHTGRGAVFMANSDAGYGVGMEMLRAISAVYDWPNFKSREVKRRTVDKQKQTQLIGEYHFDSGWQAKIVSSKQASGIAIAFPNGDLYPLTAIEDEHRYVHQDTGVDASFSIADGQIQFHIYNQVGNLISR